jgi:hypothetical protein
MNRVPKLALVSLFASVAAGVSGARAQQGETLVEGQNDPAVDIANVQAAIDQGGDVSLRGLFNFGASGAVVIKNDVNISGQVGEGGTLLTTISGGFRPFSSGPSPTPVLAPGPRISIRHLDFAGARAAAIYLTYASDIDVVGNHFSGIAPAPASGMLFQRAVHITGLVPSNPQAITGTVTVAHNVMDMYSSVGPVLCQGVSLYLTTGVEADISHNEIFACTRNSIESMDNYRGAAGQGLVRITHNRIIPPAVGFPWPTTVSPDGIVFGWYYNPAAAGEPGKASPVEVAHNYVESNGPVGVGIVALTTGSWVHHNTIRMNTGYVGIAAGTADNLIEHNTVTGTGSLAFMVMRFLPALPAAAGNYFLSNDVSMFTPATADYLLMAETTGNVVCGATGSVIDLGIGNTVSIGRRCGAGE